MNRIERHKSFEGFVERYKHKSETLGCDMKFHVYLPPQAQHSKVPVLYFLSGLTCDDTNFITKSGAIQFAAKEGIALVCPDTSPREVKIQGDSDSWDFGVGAGFYVNATQDPWAKNYKMYDYVVTELPKTLAESNLPLDMSRQSIFGHSMGGHGALICFLKNPGKYKSVSAFAPICHPASPDCAWGQKAFKGYLGEDKELWKQYDATHLMENYNGPKVEILIDQGTDDAFLKPKQLQPEAFKAACEKKEYPLKLRMQEGYDHGYFFISTFIGDHLKHHSEMLKKNQ